jgi:hypothetical protein
MAKKGAARLHGRFSPGTEVRAVHVEGAHVSRPGPQHETVETATVGKDGWVEFTGLEEGERYFAVGYVHGQPVEARLTARAADGEDASHAEMYGDNGLLQRQRLADGSFVDEPPEQHQDQEVPEGATWVGQHQVSKGTLQRSDTPRGAAAVISAEERERATRQWRKQEPVDQVIEPTPDPEDEPARTAEVPDHSKAATAKTAAKHAAKREAK